MVQKHSISKYLVFVFMIIVPWCQYGDKNKIKVGEPNYPISVITRGRRVPVAHGQILQSADSDFSKI